MRRCQVICVLFGIVFTLAQAETTSLRQQRIYEGDIAELTIEYDAGIPSLYAIDTSPLNTDFNVINVQSRISRHVQSDQSFHRMQWKIEMVPRSVGSIPIPPLEFGGNHSKAMLLQVERPPENIVARQNIYIEMDVIPENPYPGQQIRVTTRLFHNLPLHGGNLSEPETEQATVFRSGKDSRYTLLRAGESFNVLERSILLTSDASGVMSVSPPSFKGTIDSDTSVDERYIYRQGDDRQIQVRDKPAGFDNRPWLPAKQLQLALKWETASDSLQTGDTLGVTLELEASGLPAEVLPADLMITDSKQYKVYADEAIRNTRVVGHFDGDYLVGHLRQRFVLIPQQPGELLVPALSLAWWDVEHDVERVVSVEKRVLQVNPTGITGSSTATVEVHPGLSVPDLSPVFFYRHWPWLTLLALVLMLLLSITVTRRMRSTIAAQLAQISQRRRYRANLRQACMAGNASAARQALIDWGRLHWDDTDIIGLHQIEARSGSLELSEELAQLDARLFSANSTTWDGHRLWQLLARERRLRGQLRQPPESLPGPYPQGA